MLPDDEILCDSSSVAHHSTKKKIPPVRSVNIKLNWTKKRKEKLIAATGSTIHTITSVAMATPAARLSEPLNSISLQSIVFEAQ